MKNIITKQMILILLAIVAFAATSRAQAQIVGDWQGTLSVGGSELHLVLHITKGGDGALKATLDSVDQGANGIPVSSVSLKDSKLSLTVDAIHGSYVGNVNQDMTEIKGTWTQGQSFDLNFKRVSSDAKSDVTPKTPASSENTFVIKGSGWELPATLLLPDTKAPSACLVFFAGSGPTDRDWLSPLLPGKNGSAKQLAEALRAKGIGSIRFDKVGSFTNMKTLDVLSMQHYVDEASAAYDLLASKPECTKIFVLGHSEGSIHMTRTAVAKQDDKRFGGLISMSGPSRTLLDIAIGQIRAMHAQAGNDMKEVDAALAEFKTAMLKPGSATPDTTLIPEAKTLWEVAHDPRQAKIAQELLSTDPLESARLFKGRALVLSAARDAQISKEDGDRLFAAFGSPADRKQRVEIANANHVYKSETRDLPSLTPQQIGLSYNDDGHALADGVVDAISAFVLAK